jgi:hypothetical protein
MDPTYGNYNNPVPPQGQGLWDFSALDSRNPGASTENKFHEGHMPNMGNFCGVENLANFFYQPSNQFVVPGQGGSSTFEAPSALEGETPSMRQRQVHMHSCVSLNTYLYNLDSHCYQLMDINNNMGQLMDNYLASSEYHCVCY